MADFFSRLKKGIDKGTAIVSAKSNTLIETNKLKSEISAANKLKKETLLEIGKIVYEDGKAGTFTVESVEALMTTVSEAEMKIVDLEAKIVKTQDEEKEKMADLNTADKPVDVAFEEVVEGAEDKASDLVENAEDKVSDAAETAEGFAEDAADKAGEAVEDISDVVDSALGDVKDKF